MLHFGAILLVLSLAFRPNQSAFIKTTASNDWSGVTSIVYSVDSRLSSIARANIVSALTEITNSIGLTFTTAGTPMIAFQLEFSRSFCEDQNLQIGRTVGQLTRILITETERAQCGTKGWILHLLLHAFGFYHEHQRPDRDQHVYVNYANSRLDAASKVALMDVVRSTQAQVLGDYDLVSVMHYDYKAAALPERMTIVTVPAEKYSLLSFGHATNLDYSEQSVLSFGDIEALRSIFKTNPSNAIGGGSCLHNGQWLNWCLCKPGYGGRTCTDVYCNMLCQNGGTCRVDVLTRLPNCACQPGFSGSYCEVRNSTSTCACPWWSSCNTALNTCNCDPYPFAGDRCDIPISGLIPTTTSFVDPTTTSPRPAPITPPPMVLTTWTDVCDPSSVGKPRAITTTAQFIYLRLALTDIVYIADYADLGSYNAVILQTFLTESLQPEYQLTSGNTFASILLTQIQKSTAGCTVADYLAKFNQPLTSQQIANVILATYLKPKLTGLNSNKTSRNGGVVYVTSSHEAVSVTSGCSFYLAENVCKNGGRCLASDNQISCVCHPEFTGPYCEYVIAKPKNEWTPLQIILVTLGSFIVCLLVTLLVALAVQYMRTSDMWMARREEHRRHRHLAQHPQQQQQQHRSSYIYPETAAIQMPPPVPPPRKFASMKKTRLGAPHRHSGVLLGPNTLRRMTKY